MPAVLDPSPAPPRALPTARGDEGAALYRLVERLYPLHRGITGDGLRATLRLLAEVVPLEMHEVPSGTAVLDWTVPPEWRVGEAWIADRRGRRIVDLRDSPLHVVQYSTPVRARMTLAELRPHLHTLPAHPDWTPYRTSYYAPAWGFCLPHRTLAALTDAHGPFDVCLDAAHFDGALSYGECVLPGASDETVLISAHACHPALANDNASSLAVAAFLARELAARPHRRFTYRVLFAPGTIGAIAWLARNRDALSSIRHGLVLANLGDRGGFVYKQTRRGTLDGRPLEIDRAVAHALRADGVEVRPFEPTGYDERQFGSPGFDLPVGRLTRTPHAEYPEYHTSADSLSLVRPAALAGSLAALRRIVDALEASGDAPRSHAPAPPRSHAERYRSTQPFGEPQLGRRGLFAPTGGAADTPDDHRALLWTLNLADGAHSLPDTAAHGGLPLATVRRAADRLVAAGLLEPVDAPPA